MEAALFGEEAVEENEKDAIVASFSASLAQLKTEDGR